MAGGLQKKTISCAKIMLDFNLNELGEFLSKKYDQVTKTHLFCQKNLLACTKNTRAHS